MIIISKKGKNRDKDFSRNYYKKVFTNLHASLQPVTGGENVLPKF